VPRLGPEFERRYRMPRSLYEKVRAGVLEVDAHLSQRPDAAGVIGASCYDPPSEGHECDRLRGPADAL
jgi:hypothetical protein